MNSEMRALVDLCRDIGARAPAWTQGPGGNVSAKVVDGDDVTLLVKASGWRLDAVTSDRGIARLSVAEVTRGLAQIEGDDERAETAYSETLRRASDTAQHRPSMEAGFHAVLPGKYVLHFHSLAAVLMGQEAIANQPALLDWFSRHTPARTTIVPPHRPGLKLSRALRDGTPAEFYLLQNHGVVLASQSPEILKEWERVEALFCHDWGYSELVEVCAARGGGLQLALERAANDAVPLRIYFPDTAVFMERLVRVLKKVPDGEAVYALDPDGMSQDRDAAELWLATQLLYRACPELRELPTEIAATVASLPTEQWRRQLEQRP